MTSKHTPGPWRVENIHGAANDFGRWHAITADAPAREHRPHICDVSGQHRDDVSNARLIAAAPDLLAAAEMITRCAKTSGPHGTTLYFISDENMDNLTHAIARARGEE